MPGTVGDVDGGITGGRQKKVEMYNNTRSRGKTVIVGKCSCGSENIGGSEKGLGQRRLRPGVEMGTMCACF